MRLWESRTPPGFILGAADREIRGPPFFADAVGGGNGTLPGTGGPGNLTTMMDVYTTFPNNPFVDGVLVTNRFNIRDSEDVVTVTEAATGRYLSIAITDANDDTLCDHGYLGDPFLHLTLTPPPPPPPPPPTGTMILLL